MRGHQNWYDQHDRTNINVDEVVCYSFFLSSCSTFVSFPFFVFSLLVCNFSLQRIASDKLFLDTLTVLKVVTLTK